MIGRLCWLALLAAVLSTAAAQGQAPPQRAKQVEADWLSQADTRKGVTTQEDALGAVDGVKNGKWAFHTAQEKQPWWQVDLGSVQELERVVVYNRADGCGERTLRFRLLLSDNGQQWRQVYQHDGTMFLGQPDGKPLTVPLRGERGRFVRIQLPEDFTFLHLDEVEVYPVADPQRNIALWQPADQSSTSQWSVRHVRPNEELSYYPVDEVVARGLKLIADMRDMGVDTGQCDQELAAVAARAKEIGLEGPKEERRALYLRARWAVRRLAFRNPLLDFDKLLFVKRVPSSYSHMSDQHYGWWSRPGGGIFVLAQPWSENPQETCLTPGFAPGSFEGPDLSYDGRKLLFAYCRYHPESAGQRDKMSKTTLPEDAFYHVFEMNVDGTGLRQLTHGRYDDFDPRYLPSGEILFLSTRRGVFTQTGKSAAQTLSATLGDSYVRCGGDPSRPVAVYTLHVMDANGQNLRCISPFENFEWTPSVAADGRILYARWDYVDRNNMPYMKLWSMNPDGTNPKAVWGNFTHAPHCVFEARSVPGSHKILFTGSAHHAITGGSLALLDPLREFDGPEPITRLTPEVCFPEIEGWPETFYCNPWPLSEKYYLTTWSNQPIQSQGGLNVPNSMGLYLYDAFGNLELIHRDPQICCTNAIPLRPRERPPVVASSVDWEEANEGRFLLQNLYDGLPGVRAGEIRSLRIVAVPAKTHPNMNHPNLGVTGDDPGKCVLGTVPVAEDGSAYFRAPAGCIVFFQALNREGLAVQTMRTVTCVQPGQTLSCVGCHEPRNSTPAISRPQAVTLGVSRIMPGPDGSWPLRFDRLVQPVLDDQCVKCHRPDGQDPRAARFDLTAAHAYDNLIGWGSPSLRDHVRARYYEGRSVVNAGAAQTSALLAHLRKDGGHHSVRLEGEALERLVTWMDTYGQRQGSFSEEQERELIALKEQWSDMLLERRP